MRRNCNECYEAYVASILEIAIGIVLSVLGFTGVVDSYWRGMGTALITMGVIILLRTFRYKTDTAYKEKVDVEVNDERNKSLRMMAWSWTGYAFVLIVGIGSIVFKIIGMDTYSIASGLAVCLLVVLYWISYLFLNRKY